MTPDVDDPANRQTVSRIPKGLSWGDYKIHVEETANE